MVRAQQRPRQNDKTCCERSTRRSSTNSRLMNIPDHMQAAFIRQTGDSHCIEYGPLPTPCPGPGDVLVRMQASATNQVDLFIRSGAFHTHMPLPFVIGRDLVGQVVQVGAGVSAFAVGDAVWCNSLGYDGRQGAWSEFAVVPENRLYHLPEGIQAEEAAIVLHAAATAHLGLVQKARLQWGETLFVEGAGGSVGSALVQMAHAMGARVLASASRRDAQWCRDQGADVVFNYRAGDLYEQVRQAAPEGIDLWWDCSGHNRFARVLPLMAMGGRMLLMSGLRDSHPVLPAGDLYLREITVYGFAISNASVAELALAAHSINRLLALGKLRGRLAAHLQLKDAAQAHDKLLAGGFHGRILMTP